MVVPAGAADPSAGTCPSTGAALVLVFEPEPSLLAKFLS